jgi:hypothetical protein
LKRKVDETLTILKKSALQQKSNDCRSPTECLFFIILIIVPNYVYGIIYKKLIKYIGYGSIDLMRAYILANSTFMKEYYK